MDQSPKPPDDSSVLDELKKALEGSARCIELAKQEAARIDASLREQSTGRVQVEQTLLDNARKRREQLSLLDLLSELPPPSPPREPPPSAPPRLAGTSDSAEVEIQAPELSPA
jgi:hypothetical protein